MIPSRQRWRPQPASDFRPAVALWQPSAAFDGYLTPSIPMEPVLELLAPRLGKYLRRAGPGAPEPVVGSDDRVVMKHLPASPLEECVVEAVVTIDPAGRVPWSSRFNDEGGAIAAIEISEDMIEVLSGVPGDRPSTPRRARALAPPAGASALGVRPGDRLDVLRLPHLRGLGLVPVRRLGIRGRGG